MAKDDEELRPMLTPPTTPSKATSNILHTSPRGAKRRKLSHVVVPGPAYPLSAYQGGVQHPLSSSESDALDALYAAHDLQHQGSEQPAYTYFKLESFSIYKPKDSGIQRHSSELVALDRLLRYGDGCEHFLFDGLLTCGEEERWVQGVPFSILAVDGYGEDADLDVRKSIAIQSRLAGRADVWYQLETPSQEYRRFYDPFLWLVQFTRCFVGYMLTTRLVDISHFKRDAGFPIWLYQTYGQDQLFAAWHAEGNYRLDFRTVVTANIGFLRKECYSIDQSDKDAGLCSHPLWGEVDYLNLTAISREVDHCNKTTVTPLVYECFKDMYFASELEKVNLIDAGIRDKVTQLKLRHKLPSWRQSADHGLLTPTSLSPDRSANPELVEVKQGDVVAIQPDPGSVWKSSGEAWFAYVQRVRQIKTDYGSQVVLDVLWLYRPSDTTIGTSKYPFPNELFLSDNCGCGKDAIPLSSVLDTVNVVWKCREPKTQGLFVRRKFRTVHEEDSYSFVTISDTDFTCSCRDRNSDIVWAECISKYSVGDTVLTLQASSVPNRHALEVSEPESSSDDECVLQEHHKGNLEPAQVVAFAHATRRIVIRRLSRRAEDDGAPVNELKMSEDVYRLRARDIVRHCHILLLPQNQEIPCPYDRGGAGDCFFIRIDTSLSEANDSSLPPLNQSDNLSEIPRKLRGMGLFCGGGNFDRGLAEGGAVEFKYAVDWAERPLHSYRANATDKDTQYYLGSVDDYLAIAMSTDITSQNIAKVGDVDLINAGSPCPGFSDLQQDKYSKESLRNASKVASVLSFVDLYSPKYLILENVVSMTRGMGKGNKENVFSQMLACLVAMGYQVQQWLMDAWSFGSCEQRTRVFIIASVPDVEPLQPPPHSHDHPDTSIYRSRALGCFANGLAFGIRRDDWTSFPCSTIATTCRDLPDLGDGQPHICPSFPDHRTATIESAVIRDRISLIPIYPEGQGIVQAVNTGRIDRGEPSTYFHTMLGKHAKRGNSQAYSRVYRDRLVPTVMTAVRIRCLKTGRTLHWREHRTLSIMEYRRAQGYRDEEVILGSPAQQMKIIGNSVNRWVALAIGLSLRNAWSTTLGMQSREDARIANMEHHQEAEEEGVQTSACTGDMNETEDYVNHEREAPSRQEEAESRVAPLRRESLRLTDAQMEEVRADGFKAILRMLEGRPASSGGDTQYY